MAAELTPIRANRLTHLSSLCLATEHAPWPMVTVRGARHIVHHANPAFCRMMDKPTEQLVGQPLSALLPEKNSCGTLINRVIRTQKPARHTEQQPAGTPPAFGSYTMWPLLAGKRVLGVMIQVTETTKVHIRMVAMNEALLLGSMRQHALTEAADFSNARLQKEIITRRKTDAAQRRIAVMTATNRKLELEIIRRQAMETALKKSEQHQARLLEESRLMQDQLQLLSRQILSAQEEERKRISRELHDVIAQTLSTINIRLATLQREAVLDPHGMEGSIARTQQLLERAVNIVHRFARELRPTVLDDLGLIPALLAFMKGFKEETGIQASLSAFAAVEQVTGDKRIVFYRVAQEALTNVARHAQASRVEVNIQKRDGAVCLTIQDNGRGFPAERLFHTTKNQRLGLLGMRERLEMVGGTFTIQSVPGEGTTITAQIPFGKVHAKADYAWLPAGITEKIRPAKVVATQAMATK